MNRGRGTSLDQLHRMQSQSVIRDLCDAKLLAVVKAQTEVEDVGGPDADAKKVVDNLAAAVQDYRNQVSKYVDQYRTAALHLQSENQAINTISILSEKLKACMESHHYTPEFEELNTSMEKFVRGLADDGEIDVCKRKVQEAVAKLSALTSGSRYFRNLFDAPICPICMENTCDRCMPCGHVYCHDCDRDLRGQSGISTVICALCRNPADVAKIFNLHYP